MLTGESAGGGSLCVRLWVHAPSQKRKYRLKHDSALIRAMCLISTNLGKRGTYDYLLTVPVRSFITSDSSE